MKKKDLTIVIVTFNSSLVIERCLQHLNFSQYNVVVVDNNSSDETIEIVSKNFSETQIIKNDKNIGFGKANNIALRKAKTDFALILNPDAAIIEEDIEIALEIMRNDQNIALAGPRVFNDFKLFESKKNKISNTITETKKVALNFTEIDFVVGGVMFMNLKILRKIGFFDEEYFMFAEDGEICDRSKKNGYKNIFIENAYAFHFGGSSSKKSLRNIYRRFWHLGWSKSKYKLKRKNRLSVVRATLRISFKYFFESIFYLLKFNLEKSVSKFAFCAGCFSFLIGLKAFDKDGNPRG